MLARANRILKSSEFRMVMNTGERMSTKNFVIFYKRDVTLGASRFGFVVSKLVGGAVVRNSVKRRLRSQSFQLLSTTGDAPKFWLVAKCLPGAAICDSSMIHDDLERAYETLSSRAAR